MGLLTDLFSVADMAIAQVEADRAYRQSMLFDMDKEKFNKWFENHSENYINLRDAHNSHSYMVDRKVFHGSFLTGKAKWDGKFTDEEKDENKRRRNLIEEAIKKQSYSYAKEVFKNYISETENTILDSYNTFRMFQNEMSYLLTFQKDIIDSVYIKEIKELLGDAGREVALTKIKDFAWQIERHKTPAGHAVVLLMLAKLVYYGNSGFAGDIKTRIEEVLVQAEDIIIDNTYRVYLTEGASGFDADMLLQTGKDFFINGEPEKAFAYFFSACKKNNAEAQYRVGICFENGYGVYKNKEKAVFWYKKSAESDNSISKYYLARVYQEVTGDYIKAFELYKRAFEDGVAEAARRIGDMYADGKGVEANQDLAFEWYEKGAAIGSPWAMYRLYLAYLNGTGVEANSKIAEKWFVKCVNFFEFPKEKTENSPIEKDSKFESAMSESESSISETDELSEAYSELADDDTNAMENIDTAFLNETEDTSNDFHGNLLLPDCDSIFCEISKEYHDGSIVISSDIYKAIAWAEKGAAIGNAFSVDYLVRIYRAQGCYLDAINYMQRAVEYGHPYAMNMLGLSYYNGEGVDKDKVIANIWFLRAAKLGDKCGQQNIAFEFLSGGLGVPKDVKVARFWLSLAAEQGMEECQKKLAELDKQDKEQRKKELEKKKNIVFPKISEINKKIDAAQSQREEEALIKERDALKKELATLDEEIKKYE